MHATYTKEYIHKNESTHSKWAQRDKTQSRGSLILKPAVKPFSTI